MSDALKVIRSANRIGTQQVIAQLITNFFPLHGDRVSGDDPALTVGTGLFHQRAVVVAGVNRGATLEERQRYHFGAVAPAGYRKFIRGLELAEKFSRPVITLINMPGADASVAAEDDGQNLAIADAITKMNGLRVPNIAVFLGEGESGGALALATSNRLIMFTNSLYSVASPEAIQTILKGHVAAKQTLDHILPMQAAALKKLGLTDVVLPETGDLMQSLDNALQQQLAQLSKLSAAELIEQRQNKYLELVAQFAE
ncbi:carboxyltransferase subunit alpha [Loigolactobacillus backii]|uniref:acetyl-CoA carboxytransferase n=1 Tax=Loigolactobacillus backii TaxID=375175 RepID=A0A192H2I6_9LACO|nr:carboxyltransferase subunit alpha [Loigolactobacillus backii]ANK59069.1 carboxyltransferase [Loigolactobacillus backii]ANK62447.1 carboxyltransferase [Loigolactobacillus backii]ANK64058.1 carboxyltransferase [Loigolactobacillus backii]ANK67548.1 carboxyltransferase [Loigolactobacillus backii]ANK70541.1 carboxyltransferase [Loigolactobacillus backii]